VFELSYGEPSETVELDLEVVDPLHVGEMTSAERPALVARVLEQHPHLAELVPLRLRAMEQAEEGHPSRPRSSAGLPSRGRCSALPHAAQVEVDARHRVESAHTTGDGPKAAPLEHRVLDAL
jgi:hypothetical protein